MRNQAAVTIALVALVLSALAGCTHPVVARAPVLYPARVPVRAFPELLIAGAPLPEGDLMARLAAHLSTEQRHVVKKVDVKELEPMREAGSFSPLSVVLLVEPSLYSDVREDWDVVPVQICDFYWGCVVDYQSVYVSSPALVAEARLTVFEGPTARVLQTEQFEAITFARDSADARAHVFEELAKKLEHAVDVLASTKRIELVPVPEIPEVTRALELIVGGNWAGGRDALEQAARRLGGQKRAVQARVWYDLGIARWHSGPRGELPQASYESARRALTLAVSLDRRYQGALSSLQRAHERQTILDAQRRATAHNRALYERLRASIPAAPAR